LKEILGDDSEIKFKKRHFMVIKSTLVGKGNFKDESIMKRRSVAA
jgi:hypothetical protein